MAIPRMLPVISPPHLAHVVSEAVAFLGLRAFMLLAFHVDGSRVCFGVGQSQAFSDQAVVS